jgi:hypothetical protein
VEVSGQPHAPAALPPGKSPQYPLNRMLGGPFGVVIRTISFYMFISTINCTFPRIGTSFVCMELKIYLFRDNFIYSICYSKNVEYLMAFITNL